MIVSFGYHFSFGQSEGTGSSEEDMVRKSIEIMFDGMRAGDSSMVHSVFYDEAIMQTVVKGQGETVSLRNGSLQDFLKSVGTPHEQIYD